MYEHGLPYLLRYNCLNFDSEKMNLYCYEVTAAVFICTDFFTYLFTVRKFTTTIVNMRDTFLQDTLEKISVGGCRQLIIHFKSVTYASTMSLIRIICTTLMFYYRFNMVPLCGL